MGMQPWSIFYRFSSGNSVAAGKLNPWLEIQSDTTRITMNSATPCTVCGGGCAKASNCKSLGVPPDGFYSGGGGGGGHSHDDDDEAITEHWQLAQICSTGDEFQSKQQETASSHPHSPNKPSSVAV